MDLKKLDEALQPEKLLAWLKTFAPEDSVGQPELQCGCPIHEYLVEQYGFDSIVAFTAIYSPNHSGPFIELKRKHPMQVWQRRMCWYLEDIDAESEAEITAADAVECLEMTIKEILDDAADEAQGG